MPAGLEHLARRRGDRLGVLLADGGEPRLPVAHLGLERLDLLRRRRTAGSRRRGRSGRRARREGRACSKRRRRGPPRRRSRARARAPPRRRRSPSPARPGCSSAIASAIAPEPVPTSSTAGAVEAAQQLEAALDDDLGLGPRDEHAPVDLQRQPPEPPLAEDVRERLAAGAPRRAAPRCGRELVRRRARGSRSRYSSRAASGRARARRAARRPRCGVSTPACRAAAAGRLGERLARSASRLERLAAVLGGERLGELVQLALEDALLQLVRGQLDPVVGEPVLGEVVGADLLRPLAAADLRAPRRGELLLLPRRAPARRGARGGRASPSSCSGAATSRPASRRRARSAGA